MTSFWRPGTVEPGSIEKKTAFEEEPGFSCSYSLQNEAFDQDQQQLMCNNVKYRRLSMEKVRKALPIYKHRREILYCVENFNVTVLIGETGCGKTTQILQYLYEAGWTAGNRVVACTQPRRIAVTSVASRVSEEMGVSLGGIVGYTIRFDDKTTLGKTCVKYMTDGILLRELLTDPLLEKYSCIMLDEVHERAVATDLLIGLLKKIILKRPSLRIILCSATIDAISWKHYFSKSKSINNIDNINNNNNISCHILSIEGRTYPVKLMYTKKPVSDYVKAAVDTVLYIHKSFPVPGDILVFLTGQTEIEVFMSVFSEKLVDPSMQKIRLPLLQILPLYAGLPQQEQIRVFQPPLNRRTRKIVVATNVAETSVTIDGIAFVVDCGFVKLRMYQGDTGLDSLVVVKASQASSQQRAGRAGRTSLGYCYRLYPEACFSDLPKQTVPEVQRIDLASVVLTLKALGIRNILHFSFPSPPLAKTLMRALELLYGLKAINDECILTPDVGLVLSEFPLDPMLGRMVLAAANNLSGANGNCEFFFDEVITIAALLSVPNVWNSSRCTLKENSTRRMLAVKEGDHISLLNVYNEWISRKRSMSWCQQSGIHSRVLKQVDTIRAQLKKFCYRVGIIKPSQKSRKPEMKDIDTKEILKCVLAGFFTNCCRRLGNGSYLSLKDNQVFYIHPWSVLFDFPPPWLVYHELVVTSKKYMRNVSSIDPSWLTTIAPHFYQLKGKH